MDKEEVLKVLGRFPSPDLAGALRGIHPEDGVKAGKLAGLMAREFGAAAAEPGPAWTPADLGR